jgi:hypothetical protein
MSYKLDDPRSIPDSGKRVFSSPQCPDILWGLLSPLMDERGKNVKLATHLHLVPRLRIVELYLCSLIHLHAMVLY